MLLNLPSFLFVLWAKTKLLSGVVVIPVGTQLTLHVMPESSVHYFSVLLEDAWSYAVLPFLFNRNLMCGVMTFFWPMYLYQRSKRWRSRCSCARNMQSVVVVKLDAKSCFFFSCINKLCSFLCCIMSTSFVSSWQRSLDFPSRKVCKLFCFLYEIE